MLGGTLTMVPMSITLHLFYTTTLIPTLLHYTNTFCSVLGPGRFCSDTIFRLVVDDWRHDRCIIYIEGNSPQNG